MAATALLALAASACATPPIVLRAQYAPGTQRVYELRATSTTTITIGTERNVERSELRARSTVVVLSSDADGARLGLTVEPLSFVRDGAAETRDPQEVVLSVAPDGTVRSIETLEGLPIEAADGGEDLAPLLGIPLPDERLHLAERWRRDIPLPGGIGVIEQTGRVTGLRVVNGFDSAVVHIGTTRPITRQRTVDESTLTLAGTEFATTSLSFAIAEGFPVRIQTDSEGRFVVVGAPEGGGVTTETNSTLTLLEAGPRAS